MLQPFKLSTFVVRSSFNVSTINSSEEYGEIHMHVIAVICRVWEKPVSAGVERRLPLGDSGGSSDLRWTPSTLIVRRRRTLFIIDFH